MTTENETLQTERERELWKQAKRRVNFRRHLFTYLVINAFLWALWLFTDRDHNEGLPWPLWSMLGWGIGLAFDYYGAYVDHRGNAIEHEYEKLKNSQK